MTPDWNALLRALPAPGEAADASPAARARMLSECGKTPYDVAVIGAGINGAATAAALAERGARVALIDRGDIAGETSMASGNAIWGGFKYLAHGHLALVAASCRQRALLVRDAPHLVRWTEYAMPCYQGDPYSKAALRAGAWLYRALGPGAPAAPYYRDTAAMTRKDPRLRPEGLRGGIGYHEAELTTSDAHFTLQFAMAALALGAHVLTYTAVEAIDMARAEIALECLDRLGGHRVRIRAQTIVNAAGPWAEAVQRLAGIGETRHGLALRRGTFLVVDPAGLLPAGMDPAWAPRHFLTFFCCGEARPFFVYPWGPRMLVGTTDVPHPPQALDAIEPSRAEIDFMLSQVEARLLPPAVPLRQAIIETRVGVRPLAVRRGGGRHAGQDALTLSREHKLDTAADGRYLVVFGGKLTPCRELANQVADRVLGRSRVLASNSIYGAPPGWSPAQMLAALRQGAEGAAVPPGLLEASLPQFGAYANQIIRLVRAEPALAERPWPELPYSWADLVQNVRNRLVCTLDDLLRRRTNIAQWTPCGGFGRDNEHSDAVAAAAALVAAATGGDPAQLLADYRALTDRRRRWQNAPPSNP